MCNLHSIFSGAFVESQRETFSRTCHSSSDEPRDTFRLHLDFLDALMLLNFANFKHCLSVELDTSHLYWCCAFSSAKVHFHRIYLANWHYQWRYYPHPKNQALLDHGSRAVLVFRAGDSFAIFGCFYSLLQSLASSYFGTSWQVLTRIEVV